MNWEDVLKVRVKKPGGGWTTRVHDPLKDSPGGGPPPTPLPGGGSSSDDDDKDEKYNTGLDADEVKYEIEPTFDWATGENVDPSLTALAEDETLNTEDFCCNLVKEGIKDMVFQQTNPELLTPNIVKRMQKTINDLHCNEINELMQPENHENFKIFGVDLPWDDASEMYMTCKAMEHEMQGLKGDLSPEDIAQGKQKGKLTGADLKTWENAREEYRDWRDWLNAQRKGGRSKKVSRYLDDVLGEDWK